MATLTQKLFTLLNEELFYSAPVLSGNTRQSIFVKSIMPNECVICIDAEFYDMKEWKKTKKIKFTGANYNGISSYAMWVNDEGAFGGKNTRAKHWVNRTCYEVANAIAHEVGGEVINKLPIG